ncbi:MAG: hypothetical protein RTS72_05385 [Candidatus Thorarchaeota archaeon]
MWLQIMLIPFVIILVLFFIFWIVHEGTRWQKHSTLGFFARFIQSSAKRAFFTFFTLFLLLIPAALLLMSGMWLDTIGTELGPQKVDVVNIMLIVFVMLAMAFPVMYGSLGTWRNVKRAEAEEKVKSTGM